MNSNNSWIRVDSIQYTVFEVYLCRRKWKGKCIFVKRGKMFSFLFCCFRNVWKTLPDNTKTCVDKNKQISLPVKQAPVWSISGGKNTHATHTYTHTRAHTRNNNRHTQTDTLIYMKRYVGVGAHSLFLFHLFRQHTNTHTKHPPSALKTERSLRTLFRTG